MKEFSVFSTAARQRGIVVLPDMLHDFNKDFSRGCPAASVTQSPPRFSENRKPKTEN